MTAPTHSFRLWGFRKEAAFRLTERAIVWIEGGVEQSLDFGDIRQIRVYESPGAAGVPASGRCVIKARTRRRAVIVQSNHFAGIGDIEDRSATYGPFVAAVLKRAAAANPQVTCIRGMPMAAWLSWYALLALVLVVTPIAIALMIYADLTGRELPGNFFVRLSICLGLALALLPTLRLLRRNRPRVFDPLDERSNERSGDAAG